MTWGRLGAMLGNTELKGAVMPVIRKTDLQITEDRGNRYSPLAGEHAGAMELIVIHTEKDEGATTMAHSHDREEIVVVLSGRGQFSIGFESTEVGAGDTIIIPPGAVHQMSVLEGETVEALLIKPNGIRFFDPDGQEIPSPAWMPS